MGPTWHITSSRRKVAGRILEVARLGLDFLGRVTGTTRDRLSHDGQESATPPPTLAMREDIAIAYRLLLRRSPDQVGLHYYEEWVARGLTVDDLGGSLMSSHEFRQRIVP